MVELVRSGRTPEELSRELEPTAQSIWNWVRRIRTIHAAILVASSLSLAFFGLVEALERRLIFWR